MAHDLYSATGIIVLLLALPPVLWLTTVAHELGHAAAGKLTGYHIAACGSGIGRVLFRFRVGETAYFVGWRQPTNGITFGLYPKLAPPRGPAAFQMAGGILANLLVAVVA